LGFIESTPLPERACGPFLIVFSRRQPGNSFAIEKIEPGILAVESPVGKIRVTAGLLHKLQLQFLGKHLAGGQDPHFAIGQCHEQPPISKRLHGLSGLGRGISQGLADAAPAETVSRARCTIGFDQKSL
jgi:hypothetical protein